MEQVRKPKHKYKLNISRGGHAIPLFKELISESNGRFVDTLDRAKPDFLHVSPDLDGVELIKTIET